MKPIFEYIDYRQFLKDYFEEQKANCAYFSFGYFAKKAGFKSRDFIYRVMKGQKNISQSSLLKIVQALELSQQEIEFFQNLVGFNQATKSGERDFYYKKMLSINKARYTRNMSQRLELNQYEFLSKWYHTAIRSLIDLYEFRGDFAWLGKKLSPNISTSKAKKSIAMMESIGLIKKEESGRYIVANRALSTGEDIMRGATDKMFQEFLNLALNAIEEIPGKERNISGITLGINKEDYQVINDRITRFRKEIAEIANASENADRVYQLNFQIFPLSKGGKE